MDDREPQPTDVVISDPPREDTSVPLDMRIEMFKIVIQSGLQPRGETFTERVKERTEATDFIIEAFLKLREKETREARLFDAMAQMVLDNWSEDIIEGGLPEVVQRVFEHRDALREALVKAQSIVHPNTGEGAHHPDWYEVENILTEALEPYGVPG